MSLPTQTDDPFFSQVGQLAVTAPALALVRMLPFSAVRYRNSHRIAFARVSWPEPLGGVEPIDSEALPAGGRSWRGGGAEALAPDGAATGWSGARSGWRGPRGLLRGGWAIGSGWAGALVRSDLPVSPEREQLQRMTSW